MGNCGQFYVLLEMPITYIGARSDVKSFYRLWFSYIPGSFGV